MQRLVLATGAFIMLWAVPAIADRALTGAEHGKLVAAMAAEGCSGGFMKVDDGIFEVDNAKCSDGHIYDLKFDPSYRLIDKDMEH